MTDMMWVIALVAVVIVIGLVWLLRGSKTERPAERELPTETAAAEPAPTIIVAPLGAPIDVAAPVADPVVAVPVAPADGSPDNLLLMKGVGPKLATTLAGLGVTRYAQIAAWTDAEVARVDAQLGAFKGRATRDKWVEQARLLAAGDRAAFEATFGRIDG